MVGDRRASDAPFRLADGAQRFNPQLMRTAVFPDLRAVPDAARLLCGGRIGEVLRSLQSRFGIDGRLAQAFEPLLLIRTRRSGPW